jgi:hypothetical protein
LASVNHYLDANEIRMSADVPGRGRILVNGLNRTV